MQTTFKTIHDFNDYFKDEKTCYEFYEAQRWPDGPVCPHCGTAKKPYKVTARGKFKDIPSYQCSEKGCEVPFTVRTGSIYEGSKVELRKWFQAAYEISTNKKGISSYNLASRIGVSQKTAWFLNHRIRTMFEEQEIDLLGKDKKTVQIDETYIGGKNKNRHKNKRIEGTQGRSLVDKKPVVGLIEDGGLVRTFVTPNTEEDTLRTIIDWNVADDAIVVTDGYKSYANVSNGYEHVIVKHSDGQYAIEKNGTKFHTNNIENFWSELKRGYVGTHHYISPQHLHRYCTEFATRYNLRKEGNIARFLHIVKNSDHRKITYRELTPDQRQPNRKLRYNKTEATI